VKQRIFSSEKGERTRLILRWKEKGEAGLAFFSAAEDWGKRKRKRRRANLVFHPLHGIKERGKGGLEHARNVRLGHEGGKKASSRSTRLKVRGGKRTSKLSPVKGGRGRGNRSDYHEKGGKRGWHVSCTSLRAKGKRGKGKSIVIIYAIEALRKGKEKSDIAV